MILLPRSWATFPPSSFTNLSISCATTSSFHNKGSREMLNQLLEELPGIEEKVTLLTTCSMLPCYLKMPFPIIQWSHISRTQKLNLRSSRPFLLGPKNQTRPPVEQAFEGTCGVGRRYRRSLGPGEWDSDSEDGITAETNAVPANEVRYAWCAL